MSTIEHASAARTASAPVGAAANATASARPACTTCDATLAAQARRERTWPTGIAAAVAWAALGALTQLWPNRIVGFSDWAYTDTFGTAAWTIAALLLVAATLGHLVAATRTRLARVRPAGPWLVALPLVLAAWEIVTAKTGWLPTPFFAPPQALIEVYVDDWPRLAGSAGNTLKLLALGFA
ncbi:hypothetical protein M3665_24120, partial [Bacillus licheniformis]|nr:hypothetical protein [Bacillus licheniformis]